MPEGPEVEVIRRGLAQHLPGRRIVDLTLSNKRVRQQSPRSELQRWARGHCIERISRRGKYLLFHLDQGATLLIHLGMSGRLLLFQTTAPPLRHVHLILHMNDGWELVFQDTRRFGQFLIYPPGVKPPPLAAVGLDPFSRRLTPDWLLGLAKGHQRPIKNFLLDGRIIAGIGNIYASEILFAARIHPQTPVGQLSREDWQRLIKATRRILRAAIRLGGTTIADFKNGQGEIGNFHPQLKVYGQAGEPCPQCGTPLERLVQAGRSSFFCPRCQPPPSQPQG
ncbi:MAG: DNA-formamidopyrimidine glycosylase [Desulfobacca sp. 4484_104]|nr:MAG: DNA-formamidopyrimidine glycosylase [Desulfobacca sp. 4484_104]RLA90329.1 MAG: bifunctional DNA-formamidopyrimidine glycosylase/DNA-(apurinic or apyrimidinic site) lyase [Deltaproteobacteria bacterium]